LRVLVWLAFVSSFAGATSAQEAVTSPSLWQREVKFSVSGHELAQNETPFVWVADTAWTLFRMSTSDAICYLDDRAAKHFNVIQMMAIRTGRPGTLDADRTVPNDAGEFPFSSLDPVELNEAYWHHIDVLIDDAGQRNLTVALATMWGSNADSLFPNPLMNNRRYGYLLGQRYRERGNVIWLVCGEYEKINDHWRRDKQVISDEQRDLLCALARGLEAGHRGRHLMTIHPVGTSSDDFHSESWLDFNMHQTWGHASANVHRIRADYAKQPTKPVLNGEPGYENRPESPTSTAWKCRYEGYWSVFSGACGYTYGASPIWQFRDNWLDALQFEGAADMQHLRFLIESRPMLVRIPDQSLLVSENGGLGSQPSYCAALRASDGSYAMVYSTMGRPFTIDLSILGVSKVKLWWYNPRNGRCYDQQSRETRRSCQAVETDKPLEFRPPTQGKDQDWVAIFDDASRSFPAPGTPLANFHEE
jgi:hypothetical protein